MFMCMTGHHIGGPLINYQGVQCTLISRVCTRSDPHGACGRLEGAVLADSMRSHLLARRALVGDENDDDDDGAFEDAL